MATCDYGCGLEANFTFKNGKNCCSKNQAQCPVHRTKVSNRLKKEYDNGDRKSHFIQLNDGHIWKNRTHSDSTKAKMSKSFKGRKMSTDFKLKRSQEMAERYKSGWEATCGRTKKLKYTSTIAGNVTLDGKWELAVAKYLDEHNIKWQRNKKRFDYINYKTSKKCTYCPDFYLNDSDEYIEVKGYITELDICKWDQFPLKLVVWTKKELKELNIL